WAGNIIGLIKGAVRPGDNDVVTGTRDRQPRRLSASIVMSQHLTRGKRMIVDRDFIDRAGESIGPTVASGTDGPIGIVDGESASRAGLGGDESAVAIELPISAVVSAQKMNPGRTAQIPSGDGEGGFVRIGY